MQLHGHKLQRQLQRLECVFAEYFVLDDSLSVLNSKGAREFAVGR